MAEIGKSFFAKNIILRKKVFLASYHGVLIYILTIGANLFQYVTVHGGTLKGYAHGRCCLAYSDRQEQGLTYLLISRFAVVWLMLSTSASFRDDLCSCQVA